MPKLNYNPTKHLLLEELVSKGVSQEAISKVSSFGYNGKRFIDRLEIGRAIYDSNGKNGDYGNGLAIDRHFTKDIKDPFESVGKYCIRHLEIQSDDGDVIFSIDAEFPESWTENSAKVAASKYFFKPNDAEWQEKIKSVTGKPYEYSPKHLFNRISTFFGNWGQKLGYFASEEDKNIFEDELNYLQINQMLAFNSPVDFNAGLYDVYGITGSPGLNFVRDPKIGEVKKIEDGCYIHPQCHACFIKGPDDNLESILHHVVVEGGIFTNGSGVGHDLSVLRGRGESLSSGGRSSGPMSFFGVYDAVASTIKSGGKTRRAARMTTMKYTHPDIMEFIEAKPREDYKALLLMKAGLSPGFEGEAYTSVKYQNTNLSVRVDDEFFKKIDENGDIELKFVKSGKVAGKINAMNMLKKISHGSWRIGDPAMQYESKIQEMHTCKNSGPINSSNPCSEYMFLDDTSCNLASLNLLKFSDKHGNFDIGTYKKAIKIATIALDIANDAGSYPDEKIAKISSEFRTIGLGYANLGSLIMRKGLAYDSEEGRALAAALTAILTGESYKTSIEMSKKLGSFIHYEFNKEPMLDVMRKHMSSLDDVMWAHLDDKFKQESYSIWNEVIEDGKRFGFRNAQATVLAPTGTIGFLMACDTFGVEPSIALMAQKNLAGGGKLTLVNEEVSNALNNRGYSPEQISDIIDYIKQKNVVDGAPHLNPDHYSIFDTAFTPQKNGRSISFEGHIKMLGVTQPFISGAISKTNNLPETATVKDIYDGYILGHKLGLKALSVYRYNSKPVTVLNFGEENIYKELRRGEKREFPFPTLGIEHEIEINDPELGPTKFHVRTGEFEDGTVGKIFIDCAQAGSSLRGILQNFAIGVSKALTRGVSLDDLVNTYAGQEYAPKGFVRIPKKGNLSLPHPYIKTTKSIADYIFRMLAIEYQGRTEFATEPDKIEVSKLRGVVNGAIDTYRKNKIDDWDFDQVIKDSELGGFNTVEGGQKKVIPTKTKPINGIGTRNAGIFCKKGHLMEIVKSGCWRCPECFEEVGGCG